MSKIIDGTSKTLVIGEKRVRPSKYLIGEWHDDRGWSDGWDPDIMRSTMFPFAADDEDARYIAGGGDQLAVWFRCGSLGCHECHVRRRLGATLSYEMDNENLNRLGNYFDDEALTGEAAILAPWMRRLRRGGGESGQTS